MKSSCCIPSLTSPSQTPAPSVAHSGCVADRHSMRLIAAGSFTMGSEDLDGWPDDGEGPCRQVELAAFHIDATCVSNREFAAFVQATGHVTQAERSGSSYVFHLLMPPGKRGSGAGQAHPGSWWLDVQGACWHAPHGPGSDLDRLWDHPVVHVSWDDARAYAAWVGKRLPTEAQWEKAARGGLDSLRFPWGDDLHEDGRHHCNIWQGEFPVHNSQADGYLATAPVDAFRPNGLGLYNCSGNVWEWCSDWWSATWHRSACAATRVDPQGPPHGQERLIKGGSYLCHASYCNRYRLAARTHCAAQVSSGHLGFRCAS